MNIEEIAPGTPLTVNLLVNSLPVSIKTKAVMPFEGGLLVEPLVYQGQSIEAESVGSLDPFTGPDGASHLFRIDNLIPVHNWGKTFHKLYGAEIVNASNNKRKAERYVINMLGKAVINHTISTNVIVYDISMRGISLMLGKIPIKVKAGDQIALTFRKDDRAKPFNVNCRVMREFMVGTYSTVGCQMNGISPELLAFIIEKRNEKEAAKVEQSKSRVTVRQGGPSEPKPTSGRTLTADGFGRTSKLTPKNISIEDSELGDLSLLELAALDTGKGNGSMTSNGLPDAYAGL